MQKEILINKIDLTYLFSRFSEITYFYYILKILEFLMSKFCRYINLIKIKQFKFRSKFY